MSNIFVSGAPRVAHTVVKLPLKLVMKPVLPVKNNNFKITVDTNKPPVNLNDLFPGMCITSEIYGLFECAFRLYYCFVSVVTLNCSFGEMQNK